MKWVWSSRACLDKAGSFASELISNQGFTSGNNMKHETTHGNTSGNELTTEGYFLAVVKW